MTRTAAKPRRKSAGIYDPTETQFQQSVAQELDAKGLLWFHCPNEGRRSPAAAAVAKSMGLKAGVPDVLIFNTPPKLPQYKGAAIELKVGNNKPTWEQRKWLDDLQRAGWFTAVARSIQEWQSLILELGY